MGTVGAAWSVPPANATAPGGGSAAGTAPRVLYSLDVALPPNTRARVAVPTVVPAGQARVEEGGRAVWAGGAFLPGTPGISAARAAADGSAVEFSVGSGHYSFTATAVQ